MKKAIAALLASFVGLFGYQIVDKAIETRVEHLEYAVSSQQDEIESLHRLGKYSTSSSTLITPYDPGEVTLPTASTEHSPVIGDTVKYAGRKKLMYRLYYYGDIAYVNQRKVDESKVSETYTGQPITHMIGGNYVEEYFVTITDGTKTLIDIEENTSKYYDDDYSIQSKTIGKIYTFEYSISGVADPALAGKTISWRSLSTTISEDGSFKLEGADTTSVYKDFEEILFGIY